MSIFAISDLHLSLNERVNKPMDVFGQAWENHVEIIKEKWDSLVKDEDLVLLPGDLSWAMKLPEAMADLDFIHDRPGKKVLIKGNHDLWWSSVKRLNMLYEDLYFMQNDFYIYDDIAICGSRGWTCPGNEDFSSADIKIYKRESMRLRMSLEGAALAGFGNNNENEIIAMLHFPPTNDKLEPSDFTDLFEEFNVKDVVYGHLHGDSNHEKSLKGEFRGVTYHLASYDYLMDGPKLIRS